MRAALVLLAFALACGGKRAEPPPDARIAVAVPARPSLYDLAMTVTSSSGERVSIDLDRGHPTLISMFYGSCPAACPALIALLGRALEQLPPAARGNVRVLLVSFDPARDTPARLRELIETHRLDARWTLTAASDDDARVLAAVLGIKFRAQPDGSFAHTSAIVVLDADGRMVARMDGLGDPTPIVSALRR